VTKLRAHGRRPGITTDVAIPIVRRINAREPFDLLVHGELLNHEHFSEVARWHNGTVRDLAVFFTHLSGGRRLTDGAWRRPSSGRRIGARQAAVRQIDSRPCSLHVCEPQAPRSRSAAVVSDLLAIRRPGVFLGRRVVQYFPHGARGDVQQPPTVTEYLKENLPT
jgi:hypothetical protein